MNALQVPAQMAPFVGMNLESLPVSALLDLKVSPTEMVAVKWLLLRQGAVPPTLVETERNVSVKAMPQQGFASALADSCATRKQQFAVT